MPPPSPPCAVPVPAVGPGSSAPHSAVPRPKLPGAARRRPHSSAAATRRRGGWEGRSQREGGDGGGGARGYGDPQENPPWAPSGPSAHVLRPIAPLPPHRSQCPQNPSQCPLIHARSGSCAPLFIPVPPFLIPEPPPPSPPPQHPDRSSCPQPRSLYVPLYGLCPHSCASVPVLCP